MAIEFTLDPDQRRLRAATREIAHDVLADVSARTARLASPEERFAATRPAYRQLVEAGYLRKVLPESAGGDLRSTLDLALIAVHLSRLGEEWVLWTSEVCNLVNWSGDLSSSLKYGLAPSSHFFSSVVSHWGPLPKPRLLKFAT
jgi:alkylation response protein AidB-like acyl-CoA dehydrogenase